MMDPVQWVEAASNAWGEIKLYAEHNLGAHNDAFHFFGGPLIQFLAALVLRQSVQRIGPWLVVLGLELLNEWHDLYYEVWPTRYMQYGEGLKDILLTMAIPTTVLLLTRNFPHRFGMKPLKRKRQGGHRWPN